MESDKRLRTEYSFPEKIKRTVRILDANGNEVEIAVLVREIQSLVRSVIPEMSLSGFPDELVFCVNTARSLLGGGDENLFNDGLAMFFGLLLGVFMDEHGYRIETTTSPIELEDLSAIEERLQQRIVRRATKIAAELTDFRNSLFSDLDELEKAIQGGADENTGASKELGGDRTPTSDNGEYSENVPELPVGSDDGSG